MSSEHVSPDYCAHGVGIDLPCVDCARWFKEQSMSDAFRLEEFHDEYGFAYRLDTSAYRTAEPHTIPAQDEADYPSEETLNRIETWAVSNVSDVRACLDFVKSIWHDYGSVKMVDSAQELAMLHAQKGEKFLRLATGGWSGNEAIVDALRRNQLVSSLAWCLSARGGLHIYRY